MSMLYCQRQGHQVSHLINIHSGDSLSVGQDLLVWLPIEELDALVPLVHIVWVLPQHDAAQQDGPPLHEVLQPRQPGHAFAAIGMLRDFTPNTATYPIRQR